MAEIMQPEMQQPMQQMATPEAAMMPPNGQAYMMQQPEPEPTPADMQLRALSQLIAMDNVAKLVSEEDRKTLGELVKREAAIDDESRNAWVESTKRAIKRARQQTERKTFPWEGASNVNYPIVTTAALQFAARAIPRSSTGPASSSARRTGQTRRARRPRSRIASRSI